MGSAEGSELNTSPLLASTAEGKGATGRSMLGEARGEHLLHSSCHEAHTTAPTRDALAHASVALRAAAEQDRVGLGEVGQAAKGVLQVGQGVGQGQSVSQRSCRNTAFIPSVAIAVAAHLVGCVLHDGLCRVHDLAHRLRQISVAVDLARHDGAVHGLRRLVAHLEASNDREGNGDFDSSHHPARSTAQRLNRCLCSCASPRAPPTLAPTRC